MKSCVLILHNIRSTHNVGAIFRTADAADVKKIFLVGYTPTPIDKFGRIRQDIAKASRGAENTIQWEYKTTIMPLIKKLKKEKYKIISIEQSKTAINYKRVASKISKEKNIAIILGNEISGLPKSVLNASDIIAEITMRGVKESLNVSVATGIAIFRILEL